MFGPTAVLAASSSSGGSSLVGFLPIIVLVVLFYLLLIRPQQRRQRKLAETVRTLVPGTEVLTNGGLIGTVTTVEDDVLHLEIAPGVSARFHRGSIARVITPVEPEPETSGGPAPETGADTGAGTGTDQD